MHQSQPDIIIKIAKEQRDKAIAILQEKKYIDIIPWYISTGNLLGDLLGEDNTYTKGFRAAKIPNENFKDISDPERKLTIVAFFGITTLNSLIDDFGVKIKHHVVSTPVPSIKAQQNSNNRKIFIVHGHNEEINLEAEQFLKNLKLEPIILHQQADLGKTIIEKVEHYSDVGFALIILTADDFGADALVPDDENDNEDPTVIFPRYLSEMTEKFSNFLDDPRVYTLGAEELELFKIIKDVLKVIRMRARQNVVFECGFFIGNLGRSKVAVLYEENIELPSDLLGLCYTKLDKEGEWRAKIAKEIDEAGINIDFSLMTKKQ